MRAFPWTSLQLRRRIKAIVGVIILEPVSLEIVEAAIARELNRREPSEYGHWLYGRPNPLGIGDLLRQARKRKRSKRRRITSPGGK